MKSNQFQKYSKKLLPFVILCGLALLFTYGLSLTGSDLVLASQLGEGGPSSWFTATGRSGGNYISAFLSALCVDIPVVRHILIAAMLCTAVIVLLSFCGVEKSSVSYSVLLLSLLPSAEIFAHTFGNTIGATTVLIPAALTLLYLYTVTDLFVYKGRKKGWKIPFLFLSGLISQLFSESIGLAILFLSVVFLFSLIRKHGFSYHLGAHTFGCLLGITLSLLVTGGQDRFVSGFYDMVDQFTLALDLLFVENLILIGLLTLSCLILIQPIRAERSKNCNKTLFMLLIPTGIFMFLNILDTPIQHFPGIYRYLTVIKFVAVIAYLWGVLRTMQHYVSKDRVILQVRHSVITLVVFIIAFSFCGTALPNMLYIPALALVAITVSVLLYVLHRNSRLDKTIRTPLIIVAVAGVLALSFVTDVNSYYCSAVDTHIREQLAQECTEITLPCAPYATRIVPITEAQLSEYYDFPSHGEVKITYIPFEKWDWITYYDAHNVPVIQEYDEDAVETEDWAFEFEED